VGKVYKNHKDKKTKNYFSELPSEILLLIFSYLSPKSLNAVGHVNKRLRAVSTDDKSKIQANSLYFLLKNKIPNHFKEIKKLALVFIKNEVTDTKQGKIIQYIHEHLEDFQKFFMDLRLAKSKLSYKIIAVSKNNIQENDIRCIDYDSTFYCYIFLVVILLPLTFIGAMVAVANDHLYLFCLLFFLSVTSICSSFPLGLLLLKAGEQLLKLLNCLCECCIPNVTYEKITITTEDVWKELLVNLKSKPLSEKQTNLGNHRNNFYWKNSAGDIEANLDEDELNENATLITLSVPHTHYHSFS
jgi:hypothetical protein